MKLQREWLTVTQGVDEADGPGPWVLDARPLPVSGHSADRAAGVGRGTRGTARG